MSQAIDVEQMLQDSSVRIDRGRAERVRERLFGRPKPVAPSRYELGEELGRGRFGRVILAFDRELRRNVALKVVHYESPTEKARLEREAEALARISHPNVVQVYDKGIVTEGTYYLALEYVEGERLDRWLASSPRSLHDVLRVFLQIAEGLSAAHRNDLVHRDFKPSNVVVAGNGRPYVLDFGLAKLSATARAAASGNLQSDPPATGAARSRSASGSASTSTTSESSPASATLPEGRRPDSSPYASASYLGASLTEPETFVGTLLYTSPEQLGQPNVDARSDQFSYCVALFEATYGYRPFSAKSYLEQVTTGRTDRRTPIRSIPRWLRKLLQRGLSPDPRDRFQDLQEIARILRDHVEPRRGLCAGIVASVATAAVVSAWTWSQLRPTTPTLDEWDGAAIEQIYGSELRMQIEEYRTSWTAAAAQYYGGLWPDSQGPQARCLERSKTELGYFVRGLEGLESMPPSSDRLVPSLRPHHFLLARFLSPEECLGDVSRGPSDEGVAMLSLLAQTAYLQGGYRRALVLLDEADHRDSPSAEERELFALQRGIIELSLGRREAWDTLAAVVANASSPALRLEALAKQLEAGVAADRPVNELGAVAASALELGSALDEDQAETKGWLAVGLGHASVRLGDVKAALRHYDEALELFGRVPQASNRRYPVAVAELSKVFAVTWISRAPLDPLEARRALEVLSKLETYLPADHPQLAKFKVGVGGALLHANDRAGARRQFVEVEAALASCTEACEPALRAKIELFTMDLEGMPLAEAGEEHKRLWQRRADELDLALRSADAAARPLRRADAARAWSVIMQARAKLGDYDRAIDALNEWMSHGASHDQSAACGALERLDAAIGTEKSTLSGPTREIMNARTTECERRATSSAPQSTDREEGLR